MYTSRVSTVLKTFVYCVVVFLALISISACLGFIFADKLTFLPFNVVDVCQKMCTVATVLLAIHIISFCCVLLFQIARLSNWLGYVILSLIAILGYIAAWLTTPALFEKTLNFLGL